MTNTNLVMRLKYFHHLDYLVSYYFILARIFVLVARIIGRYVNSKSVWIYTFVSQHEKTGLMYTKYTYSYYGTYLLYCCL